MKGHFRKEVHKSNRIGWLRAAVLGANDGLVSTASLVVGVAASGTTHQAILVAGLAALVAGAMSMAAGEYVSVSSQSDTEEADARLERRELEQDPKGERAELAAIYQKRGLSPELAKQVAKELMQADALEAHLRDELGISEIQQARPIQAAWTSALTFSVGAILPLLAAFLAPQGWIIPVVAVVSLICLTLLGWIAAVTGGARPLRGALRVLGWGALAMAVTAGVGYLFDVSA